MDVPIGFGPIDTNHREPTDILVISNNKYMHYASSFQVNKISPLVTVAQFSASLSSLLAGRKSAAVI